MQKADDVRIVEYQDVHQRAFKALNVEWIQQHWELEAADYEILDHPREYVLEKQGHIFIAVLGEHVVGTCALLKMPDDSYELAKMAVAESVRGQGVGNRLGLRVIEQAKALNAIRIFLESNTILDPAIALYRKLGFKEIVGQDSPYERCNIQMELRL